MSATSCPENTVVDGIMAAGGNRSTHVGPKMSVMTSNIYFKDVAGKFERFADFPR